MGKVFQIMASPIISNIPVNLSKLCWNATRLIFRSGLSPKHPDVRLWPPILSRYKKKCDAEIAPSSQFFFKLRFPEFLTKPDKPNLHTDCSQIVACSRSSKICGFAENVRRMFPIQLKWAHLPARCWGFILATQIAELRTIGVTHFHFYTLNQSDMIIALVNKQSGNKDFNRVL